MKPPTVSPALLALAVLAGAPIASAAPDPRALELVQRALEVSGGAGAIERAGGLALEARGTLDLGVMHQGARPGAPEPVPFAERLVIDPARDRAAYENEGRVNSDAHEQVRFIYEGADLMTVVLLADSLAFANRDAGFGDERARFERLVPQQLLAGARTAATLRYAGEAGGEARVTWLRASGEALDLAFDTVSGVLTEASFVADVPLRGDTRIRRQFLDYAPRPGLGLFPGGYRILLGDEVLKDVRFTEVRTGDVSRHSLLRIPEGIPVPEVPPPSKPGAAGDAPRPLPEVREVAPGVHLVFHVRGGFHVLAVEFADHLMVVDAPSGWLELHQLPAGIPAADAGASAVAERLIAALAQAIPGKPVRTLVLTHAHGDHAGGARALVARGARVIGTAETKPLVEQALRARSDLYLDSLQRAPRPLRYDTVQGRMVVEDDSMRVEMIEVGANPHAEGMLVVHLPGQRLLYQSDLFFPAGAMFPEESRIPIMRFFVDWLDRSGLEPEKIYSIHGRARVPDEQLDAIRNLPARAGERDARGGPSGAAGAGEGARSP